MKWLIEIADSPFNGHDKANGSVTAIVMLSQEHTYLNRSHIDNFLSPAINLLYRPGRVRLLNVEAFA